MNINCIENKDKYQAAISCFTEFIRKSESRYFGTNGLPATWYRGQRDKDWDLLPTLLRKPVIESVEKEKKEHSYEGCELNFLLKKESELLINFKREGSCFSDRLRVNKEWYYLAQHHGLPTRLLDWTTNPRIALWFAVQPDEKGQDSTDGCIYTINPKSMNTYKSESILEENYSLNEIREFEELYIDWIFQSRENLDSNMVPRISKIILNINTPENDEEKRDLHRASKQIEEDFKNMNGKILAISPDLYNKRQACQHSFFTIHFPDLNTTNKVVTDDSKIFIHAEDKLIIPKEHKPLLRAFLSIEGMRRWKVFPDFDALAKGLVDEIIGMDAEEPI